MNRISNSDLAAYGLGAGLIAIVGTLLLVLAFGLSIGVISFLLWVGNWGLHVALGWAMLGFTKTVALGFAVAAFRAILMPSRVEVKG